jgi:glycogen debranching enzyme
MQDLTALRECMPPGDEVLIPASAAVSIPTPSRACPRRGGRRFQRCTRAAGSAKRCQAGEPRRRGIFDPEHPTYDLPRAPWFMTVFGRDSLLSVVTLPPTHAARGVPNAGPLQCRGVRRAEEGPGKILHEMRFGSRPRSAPANCTTARSAHLCS